MRNGLREALVKQQKSRSDLAAILQEQYAEEASARFRWRALFAIAAIFLIYKALSTGLVPKQKLALPDLALLRQAFQQNKDLIPELQKQSLGERKLASQEPKLSEKKQEQFNTDSIPPRLTQDFKKQEKRPSVVSSADYSRPSAAQLKKIPEAKPAKKPEFRAAGVKELSRMNMAAKSIGSGRVDDKYIWLDKIPPRYAQDK